MSVQELLRTYDCAVPGCPDEARERGGVCRYHQAENPPTVTCKTPGCTNQTAGKGGPWKNYCQHHMSEEISRRQNVRHAKAAALPVSPPQPEARKPEARKPTPPQRKPKAEPRPIIPPAITGSLVQLATECEAAKTALTEARLRHETAIAALRTALDAAA